MNRTITVNVVKEFARQDSQNGGIQGSGNVDHLRLRFSEDWDGYAKTCVFWDANGENPVKVIVGADKLEDVTKDPRTYIIDIPPEPLAVEGTYTVVIDGYLDGKRGRSETIRLKSNGAQIADDAGEPADPTPSQAEQLQQEIEKIIPNIQAVATEAKSWAVGGTGSRDGEDTDNAKYYAQQSEKSAQESAQGLENISQQVEAAKGYAESAKTESLHAANHAQSASESERNALESSESAKTAESNAKISEQSSAESARQSEEARQAIENMTASAVSVGPDAEPYVKKTSSGGVVNLEFGLRDGEPGPPGYTVPADGLYAFHIDENGDLIITYTGEEIPPFSIDQNGDLIYALAGNEVNIGHVVGGGGTGGTMNYTDLINKPSINGVELVGDKTTAELGIKDGQTPNITIGTVETLPAGSDVTASITGQTPDLVLNLGIPQGRQGDPGQAATVTVGTTTTGAPGSQASVVNSGTPNAAVLDFTIPAGSSGGGSTGELDTIADFTIEGEPVADIVINKDQSGQPFRYRKVYINIDIATVDDLGTGTGNLWIMLGGTNAYRRIIYAPHSPYTIERSLNGFAIGLDGAAVAVVNDKFLHQAVNDSIDGIPYLEFKCVEPDKFQFQPGTIVKIYGEGRME